MDYVIDDLLAGGFKPETRRESQFIEELKAEGFIYFDKNLNAFKMKENVKKEETTEDITLSVVPKINYLGLFPKVDNFNSTLPAVRVKHIMLEYLGSNSDAEDRVNSLLGDIKLGGVYPLTVLGYGKNQTNEGYKMEVPEELEHLMYKGNRVCYMTTGLEKTGKDKDTKLIDFVGVRPAKILFRIGISTSIGVFYSLEDFHSAGNIKVIDKAMLKY